MGIKSLRVRKFEVWNLQAEWDLKSAQSSFKHGFFEWAAYQAIQSLEKQLKGLIELTGEFPPKSHKLSILYKMVASKGLSMPVSLSELRKIEVYVYLSRYPFLTPNKGIDKIPHNIISREDAEICIHACEKLRLFLEKFELDENTELDTNQRPEYFDRAFVASEIDIIKNKIVNQDKFEVNKIILYGGFARDMAQPISSTLDFLIILEDDLGIGFIERIRYFRDIVSESIMVMDCLVYTNDELDFMINDEREGYLESAIREGRNLFYKNKPSIN